MNVFSSLRHRLHKPRPATSGAHGTSAFGTPKDQILVARPHADYEKWLTVPAMWGTRWAEPADWANEAALALWRLWRANNPDEPLPDGDPIGRTVLQLTNVGAKFGGQHPEDAFLIWSYVYVPDPRELGALVKVWVDDRPGLTVEQATTDPDDIGTSTSEPFATDILGQGLKVSCHGLTSPDPSGATEPYASVRYAFAVPDRQAVVTVRAIDVGAEQLPAATCAALDDFVRSLSLEFLDQKPFGKQLPGDRTESG